MKRNLFIAAGILGVGIGFYGCAATIGQVAKKYAGYTVVSKEQKQVIRDVPVYSPILKCVKDPSNPTGTFLCEALERGNTDCDCPRLKGVWVKTRTGTEKQTGTVHLLRLKSPAGVIVEETVSLDVFNEVLEGQVFGSGQVDVNKYIYTPSSVK